MPSRPTRSFTSVLSILLLILALGAPVVAQSEDPADPCAEGAGSAVCEAQATLEAAQAAYSDARKAYRDTAKESRAEAKAARGDLKAVRDELRAAQRRLREARRAERDDQWAERRDVARESGVVRTDLGIVEPGSAEGEELALRHYVIHPGTELASHTHPGWQIARLTAGQLEYTVEAGEGTLLRPGGESEPMGVGTYILRAGDGVIENPDLVHSAVNRGRRPVRIVAATLFTAGEPLSTMSGEAEPPDDAEVDAGDAEEEMAAEASPEAA